MPQSVLEQLSIGQDSVLYATRELFDAEAGYEHSDVRLALSPIPVSAWKSAYKVIAHTRGGAGAVHRVTEAFGAMSLNILSMWVAAFTPDGQVTITAIVEGAIDEGALKKDLKGDLSGSLLHDSDDALTVSRMNMLSRIAGLASAHGECQLKLESWFLDLRGMGISGHFAYDDVALVNVVPEEVCMRIAVLPRNRMYREVVFGAKISLPSPDFSGHMAAAASELAKGVNILSARSIVTSKETDEAGNASERATISFSGDFDGYVRSHGGDLRDLRGAMLARLSEHANRFEGVVEDEFFSIASVGSVPRAFIATNAKPGMDGRYGDAVSSVIYVLKALESRGLNTMTLINRPQTWINKEIKELIDRCPIFISIYIPEPGNEMSAPQGDFNCFASDWVVFEEAYASNTKEPPLVYQLRHHAVRAPRFSSNPFTFGNCDDRAAFEPFLATLAAAMSESEYEEARAKCAVDMTRDGEGRLQDTLGWLMGGSGRRRPR